MTQTSSQDEQSTDLAPPPWEEAGMAWWNALSEKDRRYWCFAAMTAVPAEAWQYFKRTTLDAERSRVVTMTGIATEKE